MKKIINVIIKKIDGEIGKVDVYIANLSNFSQYYSFVPILLSDCWINHKNK